MVMWPMAYRTCQDGGHSATREKFGNDVLADITNSPYCKAVVSRHDGDKKKQTEKA
jgi:hypothetical protein